METITVAEFFKRLCSFREKMGEVHEPEQYRNIFKMLTLSFFNVDATDPKYSTAADLYRSNANEYVQRMALMGHEL